MRDGFARGLSAMAHKIYRSDGSVLVRFGEVDFYDLELADADALALARDLTALLTPRDVAKRRSIKWTDEMKETLRRMYVDEGKSDSEIALALGSTTFAIEQRRSILRIPGHDKIK